MAPQKGKKTAAAAKKAAPKTKPHKKKDEVKSRAAAPQFGTKGGVGYTLQINAVSGALPDGQEKPVRFWIVTNENKFKNKVRTFLREQGLRKKKKSKKDEKEGEDTEDTEGEETDQDPFQIVQGWIDDKPSFDYGPIHIHKQTFRALMVKRDRAGEEIYDHKKVLENLIKLSTTHTATALKAVK